MSNPTTATNRTPYLRVQRNFPKDAQPLSVELNKSYVDIANAVNNRTIGVFSTAFSVANGETWFFNGQPNKQQALRQVYQINSYSSFAHGIDFNSVFSFSVIRGIIYDGIEYLPLPYVNGSSPTANVGMYVTSSQVVFTPGAAAVPVVNGIVILEWISKF